MRVEKRKEEEFCGVDRHKMQLKYQKIAGRLPEIRVRTSTQRSQKCVIRREKQPVDKIDAVVPHKRCRQKVGRFDGIERQQLEMRVKKPKQRLERLALRIETPLEFAARRQIGWET